MVCDSATVVYLCYKITNQLDRQPPKHRLFRNAYISKLPETDGEITRGKLVRTRPSKVSETFSLVYNCMQDSETEKQFLVLFPPWTSFLQSFVLLSVERFESVELDLSRKFQTDFGAHTGKCDGDVGALRVGAEENSKIL